MAAFFGEAGIFVYVGLAVITANIQVLKAIDFFAHPVAMGTVVFSSTFLAVDILVELYGADKAKKAVWVGFISSLFIAIIMNITIMTQPSTDFIDAHKAMVTLFKPTPAIFAASIISYLVSQYTDVWIFKTLKNVTRGRLLWLRTIVASATSALVDSVVFSYLAWVAFSYSPISWELLIFTYILGTYYIRLIISVAQVPFIYCAKSLLLNARQKKA